MNRETKGTIAALVLTAIVTKLIVDRDWRQERAHTESMQGRGYYGPGKASS